MALDAIGPLQSLSVRMRPSGAAEGAPEGRPEAPAGGPAQAGDSVELSAASRRLEENLRDMTEALRGSGGSTDDSGAEGAADVRRALVALENVRAAAEEPVELDEAARRLEAGAALPAGEAGALPSQRPGIFALVPQRILQLLGD